MYTRYFLAHRNFASAHRDLGENCHTLQSRPTPSHNQPVYITSLPCPLHRPHEQDSGPLDKVHVSAWGVSSSISRHTGFRDRAVLTMSHLAYPQSNGKAERAEQTVGSILSKSDDPHLAMLAYSIPP
ncbi:unnamed protein product [Clavelina lepadiformis]|uniref:Uncharacterized protein n=1 Tax=Clavelina lepadiformis TaxID=159417 RepID=A0ABP0GWT4_CLALP